MRKFLKILGCLGAVLFTATQARAQLDNRAFISAEPGKYKDTLYILKQAVPSTISTQHWRQVDSTNRRSDSLNQQLRERPGHLKPQNGELRLCLNSFTFFKDNEYFNDIVEGYTLFGTQLNPQLVYYPVKELRLEAGVFFWKDFGNPQLRQVRPTFRATWTKGNQQFIFGNIRPHLNHGYIEPLLDFERVILKPLEEGLQYRLNSKRVSLDVWVDWLKQEYPGVAYQEQIAGGLSSSFRLTKDDVETNYDNKVQVSIPFQFTARHAGGQIDTLHAPIQTLFNYATGVVARLPLRGRTLQAVRLNAYGLLFDDHSMANYRLPFQNGNGLYLNGTLETRYANLMLSYWQGHQYYSPLGGPYYESVASRYGTPGYTEANRRLLFVRLLRDFRVADAAAVTVRIEPVYDFSRQLLDFSFGVYFNFRQEWLLGNVGRRVRAGQ